MIENAYSNPETQRGKKDSWENWIWIVTNTYTESSPGAQMQILISQLISEITTKQSGDKFGVGVCAIKESSMSSPTIDFFKAQY